MRKLILTFPKNQINFSQKENIQTKQWQTYKSIDNRKTICLKDQFINKYSKAFLEGGLYTAYYLFTINDAL